MKEDRLKLFRILFLLLLAAPAMAADVSFTANLRNWSSRPTVSYLMASISDCGAGNIPRVISGPNAGVKSLQKQKFTQDGTGLVSDTITPNADITCGVSTGTTRYLIEIFEPQPDGQPDKRIFYAYYTVGPGAFVLETADQNPSVPAPATANAVLKNPTATQNVVQPTGTSLQVTGLGGVDFTSAGFTRPVKSGLGADTPVTCTANKDLYIKTDATAGQQLFLCNSAGNGYNLVGDGGGGGGGSGTVTSFSAGDLVPLFTTTEANVTTTPALSFTLSNANANTIFAGPASGAAAAPAFRSLVSLDIPNNAANTTGTAAALAADPVDCTAGNFPLGVNASGTAVSCTDAATQAELDTHSALTTAHSSTSANTASRIMQRGASGEFSAGQALLDAMKSLGGTAIDSYPSNFQSGYNSSTNAHLSKDRATDFVSTLFVGSYTTDPNLTQTDAIAGANRIANVSGDAALSSYHAGVTGDFEYFGSDTGTFSTVGTGVLGFCWAGNSGTGTIGKCASVTARSLLSVNSKVTDLMGFYAPSPEISGGGQTMSGINYGFVAESRGALGTGKGGFRSFATGGSVFDETIDATGFKQAGAALNFSHLAGTASDAQVPDNITASNYLALSGGTLTGLLTTDNLGIELDESDTNPTCAAGNFNIFADLSELKLKKCTNGVASDLDTTGAGSGDSITVNAVAVVDADFDDATPVAPTSIPGSINVAFQKDSSSPANISAYVVGFTPRPSVRIPRWVMANGTGTLTLLGENTGSATGTAAATVGDATWPVSVNYASAASTNAVAGINGDATERPYRMGRNIYFATFGGFAAAGDYAVSRTWLGLGDQTLATMVASSNPAGNYAAFRWVAGTDTNWQCVTKDNTTQNVVASSVAGASTTPHLFEMIFDDTAGNITFKIDGVTQCGGAITTNRPTAGTMMTHHSGLATLENVAKNWRITYIYGESSL